MWVVGTEGLRTGPGNRCGTGWEARDEGEVHPRRPLPSAAWSGDSPRAAAEKQTQTGRETHLPSDSAVLLKALGDRFSLLIK